MNETEKDKYFEQWNKDVDNLYEQTKKLVNLRAKESSVEEFKLARREFLSAWRKVAMC